MPSISDMQARVTEWADGKGWWTPQCKHEWQPIGQQGYGVDVGWCGLCGGCRRVVNGVVDEWLPKSATERNPLELMMLFVTEVAEAAEEWRNGHALTEVYYNTVMDTVEAKVMSSTHIAKPEGVPTELADIVIRIMDMCGHYGIDLETEIANKMAYNDTRAHRHGGKRA